MNQSTELADGTVDEVNPSVGFDCVDDDGEGIVPADDQATGDSGGPGSVGFSNGDGSLIGINTTGHDLTGAACGADESSRGGGTTGYRIENEGYETG
jgi:hypothetical protein